MSLLDLLHYGACESLLEMHLDEASFDVSHGLHFVLKYS